MSVRTWLGQRARIARAEWTRHRREFGHPLTGGPVLLVVFVAIAIALGWLGHSLGRNLATGQPLPYDVLSLLVSIEFVFLVWRSSQYTQIRFERLSPDHLLTTVPTRTAVLGLLGFVAARLTITLAIPTLGVAVGTAIGLRSPTVALTILVATGAMAVLAVALGTTVRLAGRFVALRLVRVSFYRDLFIVFGWIPLMIGYWILQELSVSLAPVFAVVGALPLAWFVDLAFVGGLDFTFGSVGHALGALGLLVPTVPLLVAGATVFARRVWESEPVSSDSSARRSGSHSLIETGVVERFVGDRIPRAMYTVARERWLKERRVPQGLLSTGYVLLLAALVGLPIVGLFGGPTSLLLLVSVSLGLAVGIAFGSDPIGTEYRTLPMLFTTVTGRQYVAGLLLAVLVIGVPVVALLVLPLGVSGVVGTGQTILIALIGMVLCACTAAVALAVGLGVERYEYGPAPFFFIDVPIYAEHGMSAFLRLGLILAIGALPSVPAFVGNAPPVYEAITARGVPVVAVQIGSLFLTLLLIAVVTRTAFKIAVQRFRDYQIG